MTTDFGPEDMVLWEDAAIADYIAEVMDNHHDIDVSFADHARHIVSALRDNGLLADAALDVEGMRNAIDRLTVLGREMLGNGFSFITVSIWSHKDRGPDGFTVYIHGEWQGMPTQQFHAQDPAAALRAAEDWIRTAAPATREAEGWAILGVVRA